MAVFKLDREDGKWKPFFEEKNPEELQDPPSRGGLNLKEAAIWISWAAAWTFFLPLPKILELWTGDAIASIIAIVGMTAISLRLRWNKLRSIPKPQLPKSHPVLSAAIILIATGVYFLVAVAALEEWIYRWVNYSLIFGLSSHFGLAPIVCEIVATLVSAAIFAHGHRNNTDELRPHPVLESFLCGIALALIAQHLGLVPAIVAHYGYDHGNSVAFLFLGKEKKWKKN